MLIVVGTDIEIKFKPSIPEEHIKESISEDNCIEELPLKCLPTSELKKVL